MKGFSEVLLLCFLAQGVWSQTLAEVEKGVFERTNTLRIQAGIRPLTLDPMLSEIARGHSEEMFSQGYFGHDSPNQMCKTVRDRLRFGHRFSLTSSENLHRCQGYELSQLAKLAVDSWSESPAHHRNLVNPSYNRLGVGIAKMGDTYLFTQLFSYEPVIVQSLDVQPEGAGFRVKVSALVCDGPREGGWFVDGKRLASWIADAQDMIHTELFMARPGNLEIGQLISVRLWDVETTIPIPPPEMHTRHSWLDFPWLDFLSS